MSEHWIKDRANQRYFFAWLGEAKAMRGLKDVGYEQIKREGLGVAHIEEFVGTIAQAQAAVLEYLGWLVGQGHGVKVAVENDGVEEIPW